MESVCACLDSGVSCPCFFVGQVIQSLESLVQTSLQSVFSQTAGEGGIIFAALLKQGYKSY